MRITDGGWLKQARPFPRMGRLDLGTVRQLLGGAGSSVEREAAQGVLGIAAQQQRLRGRYQATASGIRDAAKTTANTRQKHRKPLRAAAAGAGLGAVATAGAAAPQTLGVVADTVAGPLPATYQVAGLLSPASAAIPPAAATRAATLTAAAAPAGPAAAAAPAAPSARAGPAALLV